MATHMHTETHVGGSQLCLVGLNMTAVRITTLTDCLSTYRDKTGMFVGHPALIASAHIVHITTGFSIQSSDTGTAK